MAPSSRAALTAGLAGGLCWSAGRAFLSSKSPGVQALRGAAPAQLERSPENAAGARSLEHGFAAGASLFAAAALGAAARRSAATPRAAASTEVATAIPRPEDLLESPKFPLYEGSTGGYMSRATRERHAITWTAKEATWFEMPTGGTAMMNQGENLCYFRKKEQCIALGKELRKMNIENYKIYRIAKDGTVTFMHPADGVFPEKVNKGRVQVNGRPFTVCQNAKPGDLKWTKYHMKTYEADPLTTMFVKARVRAFEDIENLFCFPNPTGFYTSDEEAKKGIAEQAKAAAKSL